MCVQIHLQESQGLPTVSELGFCLSEGCSYKTIFNQSERCNLLMKVLIDFKNIYVHYIAPLRQ